MSDPLIKPIAEYFILLKTQLQELDNLVIQRTDSDLLDTLKEHKSRLNNLINNFEMTVFIQIACVARAKPTIVRHRFKRCFRIAVVLFE